jgi:glycosyltransferase involved in cell wall biosynthesis
MATDLIAIDASGASRTPVGADRYALSLIKALPRVDEQHDYLIYARGYNLEELRTSLSDRFRLVETGPWPPGGRRLWLELGLPLDLKRRRVRLLHSPSLSLPALAGCAQLATITDLGPVLLPDLYSRDRRKAIETTVNRADALLVPSQSLAEEVGVLAGPDKPIHVTPAGVDATFRPMEPEMCMDLVHERYGLPPGYLLSVGQTPAKNRGAILRAVRRLRDEGRDVQLALVGEEVSREDRQVVAELNLEAHVYFCGYVPQADLPLIYNAAALLLQPSLHDGLGLTILEAMACSTPLVTADRSTPPELAGQSALIVDPHDVEAIAAAAAQILDDPNLVSRLRFDGLKRAAEFSWEACAERTAAVYSEVLAGL